MGKRNLSFLSLPCPGCVLLEATIEQCNGTSSVLMLTVIVCKGTSYHGLILTAPNHAINSLRFTCNILQT